MSIPQKLLFIDRDGVLIDEPPQDFQVDSLEKLSFVPGVFTYLGRLAAELDYQLILVTNQDGLGTASFPEETFWPAHNKMMEALANEGIHFKAVHIDRSFPDENKATRKPGIAMLTEYLQGPFDLSHSYVIGDRLTDMQLAQNLGAKGILLRTFQTQQPSPDLTPHIAFTADHWRDIYEFFTLPPRKAQVRRKTKETDITITLNLDGQGHSQCQTGLGFFDHMLDQLAKHGGIDLEVLVHGDLHIDEHHTIEDTAITLGQTFYEALGDKKGLFRYGFCLPMDDCLAQVAIDFGGRNWLVWEVNFIREKIGDVPTEMFMHFFKSFSDSARCNLNIKAEGTNEHHKVEAIFKAWARAIRMAIHRDRHNQSLPTTKGLL